MHLEACRRQADLRAGQAERVLQAFLCLVRVKAGLQAPGLWGQAGSTVRLTCRLLGLWRRQIGSPLHQVQRVAVLYPCISVRGKTVTSQPMRL